MSDTETEIEIDGETQEHIRAEIRRVAGKRPMTVVAQETGIAYGTFSSWIGGTYAGNTSRIAAAGQRWIDAQATKSQTRAAMPKAPEFVETPTARAIISVLEFAQFTPDLVMIAGGAGVGKTTAVERHLATNPNVFVLTGEPCFSTPRMLLDCLKDVLGLTEKYSSQTVSRAIVRRLQGTGGLVVVDEAQHLSSQSLDQMRTIHDLAKVGVALVGNETVYTRLEGHARQAQFAQLFSRVGMRISRTKPQQADIAKLIDAWGVEGADERRLLTDIARRPGALRGMTKALRMAHMLAAGAPVTAEIIRRAWEQISATKIIAEAA
jgi:DNA transposition AAA+ family ATPase